MLTNRRRTEPKTPAIPETTSNFRWYIDTKGRKYKCDECGGAGRNLKSFTEDVTIPAGVDTGMLLRLRGEGEPGQHGGPSGDVFVEVHVEVPRAGFALPAAPTKTP